MSSLKVVPPMFSQMAQPLRYAEALLERLARLSGRANREGLLNGLVESAAQLSDCELSQLYLLDDTHTRLTLSAEWLDGAEQSLCPTSLPSDYHAEQLLQFCLCQNQVLSLPALDTSVYDTQFLPVATRSWRSLLCLPLLNANQEIGGLLLVSSRAQQDLQPFTESLALLGRCVLAQLYLLQRFGVQPLAANDIQSVPCASGYGLIGESPKMRTVYQLISKVLHNSVSVLLTGETGTGKELVAQAIHDCGSRRSKPFVVQNCAALPENLLESELFGYRKGAFTGADRDRKGLLDQADGGTLFLDEMGDMPLALQAKLLRFLQEGEVRPLGTNDTHKVDVRVLAATHCDLRALVTQGRFREDLFYRLSNFPIELPPLRERNEDILRLARHFADKACSFLQRQPCDWSDDALQHLAAYGFPGNVRELKGLVERAVLLCDDSVLLPEHFNLLSAEPRDTTLTLRERMELVERNLLMDCLRKNQGNQTSAASELGLPRRTLLYRMQRLNINPAELKFKERACVQPSQ